MTIQVRNATGDIITLDPVTATAQEEGNVSLAAILAAINDFDSIDVAASQTNAILALDGVGAAGNFLNGVEIFVEAASGIGNVTLTNGTGSAVEIFNGTLSLAGKSVAVGARSVGGPWKITTGANVHVKASVRT